MHFLRSCDCTQCYAYIYCNYSIYTEDFDLFHKSADDLTEVLQFLNYHVFVSQVTHWYSRRRRERVEEVTEKVSLVHAHTHSWTSASLRMMCTLRYLLKSFVFFVVFWRPSHVAHLAFTLLQAHSATQSGSTDSLVHVLGTLTGQEVIGTSHKNAQKIARRSRKHITDKCPAVFVIVFWGGMLMLMSAEGGRGQCALPA